MMRRLMPTALVAVAIAMVACSADQPSGPNPTPLTPAQLAMHFDTLAGQLLPGDPRLIWYQDIVSIVGDGVSPNAGQMHINGAPAVFEAATEIDAFPDSEGGKRVADSTYRLAAWGPATRPTQFLDLRVRWVPNKSGTADTAKVSVTFYLDSTGKAFNDTTEFAQFQLITNRGLCQRTAVQHLTVPTNPCTKIALNWLVGGGTNVLTIDPADQVSGTHLTQ